jgi:hypothetical protein
MHARGLSVVGLALWSLSFLLAAPGCGGPAQWRYEKALEESSESAAHVVHEARLTALMQNLDLLRDERLPQALDAQELKDREAFEISRVAQAMAESAMYISRAVPLDLEPPEREAFQTLAMTLERLCRSLAVDASRLTTAQNRAWLVAIDATCDQCHGRFRIPGVERDER